MKLLVFSDSHGELENMLRALELHKPDMVIHLGDSQGELHDLKSALAGADLVCVKGNCDTYSDLPERYMLHADGANLLLCHGHRYGVRMTREPLAAEAAALAADAALYGHTHVQLIESTCGVPVVNPGSVRDGGRYCLVEINSGKIDFQLLKL